MCTRNEKKHYPFIHVHIISISLVFQAVKLVTNVRNKSETDTYINTLCVGLIFFIFFMRTF